MTISITKEYLIRPKLNQGRFVIDFHGTSVTTTVTSTPKIVRKWLRTTYYLHRHYLDNNRLVVGLGVQWRPASSRGKESPAATLQLCVGRRCLIFQLIHSATVPKLLRRFLEDYNHTFVGMWNHSDATKLSCYSKHMLFMASKPLDLRNHAVSKYDGRSLRAESRETIVRECLGLDVEFHKWIDTGRSNWDDYELDFEQIMYAAVDAHCSFLIGKDLRAWEIPKSE